MSASKSLAVPAKGGHALDAPVAALAGLSVAFLAFVAPAGLLADVVAATGLPSLVPAASPPLGFNARLGLASAGAVGVFALVFLLLRWLGRSPQASAEAEAEKVPTPRVRRRDFHPDAPPRPPILAGAEFGEPAPEPEPEPAAGAELDPLVPATPEPEPIDQAEPVRPSWLPDPVALEEQEQEQEPEPEPDPVVLAGPEPEPEVSDLSDPTPSRPSWLPERQAEASTPPSAPPPPPPPFGTSIAELMERLEHGLARRRTGAAIAASLHEPPAPDPADDRLRSAIDSLQRLAARQR